MSKSPGFRSQKDPSLSLWATTLLSNTINLFPFKSKLAVTMPGFPHFDTSGKVCAFETDAADAADEVDEVDEVDEADEADEEDDDADKVVAKFDCFACNAAATADATFVAEFLAAAAAAAAFDTFDTCRAFAACSFPFIALSAFVGNAPDDVAVEAATRDAASC